MFNIPFLSFRYKFHEGKNLPVFLTMCFWTFAGHPNPTMNVIKAVVRIKPPHNCCPLWLRAALGAESFESLLLLHN